MLQTLTDLRAGTLRYCDDPVGDLFAPGGDFVALDGFINEAYQDVVDEVDESLRPWNTPKLLTTTESAASPGLGVTHITPVATQREYEIGDENIRRVLDVVEISATSDYRRSVPHSSWGERDNLQEGVYVFRRASGDAAGAWFLGITDWASVPYALLEVNWLRLPEKLTTGEAIPIQVPASFHELIYYLAAVKAKSSKKQDPTFPLGFYTAGLSKMKRLLGKVHHSGTAPRLSGSKRFG